MADRLATNRRRLQVRTVGAFRVVERVFYVIIALALALAGAALFVNSIYTFAVARGDATFIHRILELLDGMLLVFIVTELLHTVRAVIDENVLMTEPFLIVGVVAVIRRLIVISAEAQDAVGTDRFADLMVEMGILIGAVVGLGAVIFLLRHTEHGEPRPAHEVEAARRPAAEDREETAGAGSDDPEDRG